MSRSKITRIAGAVTVATLVAAGGSAAFAEGAQTDPAAETLQEEVVYEEDAVLSDEAAADGTVEPTEDEVTTDAPEDEVPTEESEAENHGQEVSTFARETDLEGRERGQAVAAVARDEEQAEPSDEEATEQEPTDESEQPAEEQPVDEEDDDTSADDDSDLDDDASDADDDDTSTDDAEDAGDSERAAAEERGERGRSAEKRQDG